jgi:hypothetical protein
MPKCACAAAARVLAAGGQGYKEARRAPPRRTSGDIRRVR